MNWSWFAFVIGLLVGALAPVGLAKLRQLITSA